MWLQPSTDQNGNGSCQFHQQLKLLEAASKIQQQKLRKILELTLLQRGNITKKYLHIALQNKTKPKKKED